VEPHLPLQVVTSRRYALGALAGCLVFVAIGVWVSAANGRSVDWGPMVFFGGGSLLFVRPALRSRLELTIDRDGIDDRRLRMGTIRWEDITGAWLVRVRGLPMLCLRLERRLAGGSPSRWRRLLSRSGDVLGLGDVCVSLAGLRVEPDTVLALVERHAGLASTQETRDVEP
jgi:hypothetical protein